MVGADSEEHYVARIQEVYEGFPAVGNVFLADKEKPYGAAGLGEIVVAWIGKVLGMSAVEVNVFSKFLFPFLIVLLIYALVYSLIGFKSSALIAAAAPILGYNLISETDSWLALLRGEAIDNLFLVFARPINPEVSSICLFAVLLLVYRGFYLRSAPRLWEIIAVDAFTCSYLYISPYVFSFLGLLLLVSCLWFLYRRDYRLAVRMFAAGALALILLIPFLVNYFSLHESLDYAAFAMRTGVVTKHVFLLGFWIPLMALAVFFLWPKEHTQARIFLLTVFFAIFLVINQQVLTGLYLHPGHYHWYITKPLVAIMVGIYAGLVLENFFRSTRLYSILFAAGMGVLFYNAALWQITSYTQVYPVALAAQSYAPVFTYLNSLPDTQTIWTNDRLSLYIPMYTQHNTPSNHYVIYYLNPHEFYEKRAFLMYRLKGVTPTTILETMKQDRNDLSQRLFGMFIREDTGIPDAISEETFLDLEKKYKTFYARPYAEVFKDLGITMLLAPREERANYETISALVPESALGDYLVYTLRP